MALRGGDALSCDVHFEREFMHWTEFPPDAHRGYDLGAAVVELRRRDVATGGDAWHWSPALAATRGAVTRRVYSNGLQVIMPTPDFSMPYNVICLSGTVWALFFGNIFNALIRRHGELRKGGRAVRVASHSSPLPGAKRRQRVCQRSTAAALHSRRQALVGQPTRSTTERKSGLK